MISKEWSGKIMVNGVIVSVKAVISSSPNSPLKEWHGSGTYASIDEFQKLNDAMMNREEFQTKIGTLFFTNLSSDGTFTFQGTGKPLFYK